jgi:cytidylate kinase
MAIVTISRQFGSDGARIATEVARELGYHLVDREVLKKLFEQYGLVDFEDVYDAETGGGKLLGALLRDPRDDVLQVHGRIVREVAHHGDAVVVGRGAYAVLRADPYALHVRVQAPSAVRAERIVARRQAGSPRDAEALIAERDRHRSAFVEKAFGIPFDDTSGFDLVVDTGKLPVDIATSLVVQAARAIVRAQGDAPLPAEDDVDPVMASAVADALKCHTPHRAGAPEPSQPMAPPESLQGLH